jgi:hypothetical protein
MKAGGKGRGPDTTARRGRCPLLWKDAAGSLTVEAMLILPLIFLLMALFLRWGLMLRDSIQETAEKRPEVRWQSGGEDGAGTGAAGRKFEFGFLRGGAPAWRIWDADTLIDYSYAIKEWLPVWFHLGSGGESE